MSNKNAFTFASVSFANAVPFTHFLPSVCPGSRSVFDPPAKLADLLLKGVVDAALIPVVDLFLNPSLRVLDDIGISASGATTSTLIKCYRPLSEVNIVMKDRRSSTSNVLAAILFEKQLNVAVTMEEFCEGKDVDAEIVIGDRALCLDPAPFGDYDLSEEWLDMTGLPFVFAVWACRNDCPHSNELSLILHNSLDKGQGHIDEIAAIQAERLSLPIEQCREYLSDIIRYRLGDNELKGMELFRTMVQEYREAGL